MDTIEVPSGHVVHLLYLLIHIDCNWSDGWQSKIVHQWHCGIAFFIYLAKAKPKPFLYNSFFNSFYDSLRLSSIGKQLYDPTRQVLWQIVLN